MSNPTGRALVLALLLLPAWQLVAAQAPPSIAHASWLAGCWMTQRGKATIEEQ